MIATREFRLLLECCRSAFPGTDGHGVAELARQIDWPLFVRLARFHRVEGLVAKALRPLAHKVPEQAAAALMADAEGIAARNLHSAVESQRLLMAFAGAGVQLLFVKGLTLGALAYGNPSIKAGIDIDLLIAPDQLGRAAEILRREGWKLSLPNGDDRRLAAWHRTRKESVWRYPAADIQADLHTQLGDNPRLIPTIGIDSPQIWVSVAPGIELPTLARDELFAYLAVHGASSAWFRLKWITDLAALLRGASPKDVERLYRRSQQLGAGRAPAQALLLADALYGTLQQAPALKRELAEDHASRRLAAIALKLLAGREEPREPTARALGTAPIHYAQLLLLPDLSFKLSELWRQARAPFS
jgi:hypothetical protein